jgi:hypothetical protein
LKEFLSSQPSIADKFEIIGKQDRRITGNFEVTVLETGTVLHSKQSGLGKAESSAERMAILEKVQEMLDEEDA